MTWLSCEERTLERARQLVRFHRKAQTNSDLVNANLITAEDLQAAMRLAPDPDLYVNKDEAEYQPLWETSVRSLSKVLTHFRLGVETLQKPQEMKGTKRARSVEDGSTGEDDLAAELKEAKDHLKIKEKEYKNLQKTLQQYFKRAKLAEEELRSSKGPVRRSSKRL